MFMETSAKTASNVNELFVAIGACVCSPLLGTGLAMLGRRGHSQMETFCSLSLPSESRHSAVICASSAEIAEGHGPSRTSRVEPE